MEFRILGPLEVVDGTTVVRVAAGRERRLLLLLLIHAPQPVSLSAIVDALWPDDPPSSAQKIVQNYVLRLRKALGADTNSTVSLPVRASMTGRASSGLPKALDEKFSVVACWAR